MSHSITVDSEQVTISTETIFHRMILTQSTSEKLAECLQYKLSPFPSSLFINCGLRKKQKSALFDEFDPLPAKTTLGNSICEVIDGGFLLHKVIWPRDATFKKICANYVKYISRNYRPNPVIVFDGYPEDGRNSNTKSAERRTKGERAIDKIFVESTKFSKTTQTKFLANERNKKNFVEVLKKYLLDHEFSMRQAWEDAVRDIVQTAVEMSPRYNSVVVVGEDTDLLVLICPISKTCKNIYFHKAGRGATASKLYSAAGFKHKLLLEHILFIHAFSGCDTVSAICGMRKKKIISIIKKNPHLLEELKVFKKSNTEEKDMAAAGERVLISLYGGRDLDEWIDKLRFKMFAQLGIKTKTDLARLLPTSSAARQHSFRTYQIQKWLGEEKNALEWGWKMTSRGLEPVTSEKEPIPGPLLKIISCGCTTPCGRACGCRKVGLICSVLCKVCCGETCSNIDESARDCLNEDNGDSDDDIPTMVFIPGLTEKTKRKTTNSTSILQDDGDKDGDESDDETEYEEPKMKRKR